MFLKHLIRSVCSELLIYTIFYIKIWSLHGIYTNLVTVNYGDYGKLKDLKRTLKATCETLCNMFQNKLQAKTIHD